VINLTEKDVTLTKYHTLTHESETN